MREVDIVEVREFISAGGLTGTNEEDSPALKFVKRLVPHGWRYQLRAAVTALLRPWARHRVRRLMASGPIRLNLGSGSIPREGYVNVDFAGAPADLTWDLRRGIPFEDDSVEAVYSSHVFEHIPLAGGLELLSESYRVLRPGTPIRIVVPDAGVLLGSYSGTNDDSWAQEFPTPMLAVNRLFYEHRHCAMYDAELLIAALQAVGFIDVSERQYEDTALVPCPDDGKRKVSLFVEGCKPTRSQHDRFLNQSPRADGGRSPSRASDDRT
jgi:predicted SAM-dependent methyltransferase